MRVVAESTKHQIEIAFKELRRNFYTHQTKSLEWRKEQLKNLKGILEKEKNRIFEAKKKDLGMKGFQSYLTAILTANSEIDYNLSNIDYWVNNHTKETPFLIYPSDISVKYEPLGMTLILGAWNYPFNTVLSPLIDSISAGNCCIVKPSEQSAHSSEILKEIIDQLDQKFFRCLEGGKDTAVELLKNPFNHVIFTGSSFVGKLIAK